MLEVLVVDDDDIVRTGLADALVHAGHRVAQASDGEKALSLVVERAFDLAVCDVQMPKMDGLTLLRRLRREAPGTVVLLMTSFGQVPDAVRSLREGAVDYLTKPFDPDQFVLEVVGPIAERHALRKAFEEARARFVSRETGASLVGTSLVMRQLTERMGVVAQSDAPVLITGETGTGKKLIARTIHAESPRRDGPLVIVPCAALPERMLASELRELSERPRDKDEWFRAATGGTLVLDGIDALPVAAQGSLMRVIDEPTVHARRSRDWQPLGVRIVSLARRASRERDSEVGWGFLEPLYFRLNAVHLHVPSLRERAEDLYALVSHYLRELTPPPRAGVGLTPGAWRALAAYAFPGNVGELVWVLQHALALADGAEIDVQHLPGVVTGANPRNP